jgi:hypothetical protein
LELQQRLQDKDEEYEEVLAEEWHSNEIQRLEERAEAATQMSELTEECEVRVREAEESADDTVKQL